MLGGMWLCLVPWAAQGVDATALRLRVLLFTAGSEASQTPSALDAFAPGASCQPQPRRAAGLNQTPPGSSQGDRNPGPGSAIRRGDAPAAFASSSPLPEIVSIRPRVQKTQDDTSPRALGSRPRHTSPLGAASARPRPGRDPVPRCWDWENRSACVGIAASKVFPGREGRRWPRETPERRSSGHSRG
ncbi:uncharacterized protein LOC141936204 isoform X3 [Strix uralensis]|uniref:uncharacterized protein LOC141936204 isoform X3 n=1 Tax=Strix uralensis TaxID=36305 RepID=UPI003DA75DCB